MEKTDFTLVISLTNCVNFVIARIEHRSHCMHILFTIAAMNKAKEKKMDRPRQPANLIQCVYVTVYDFCDFGHIPMVESEMGKR